MNLMKNNWFKKDYQEFIQMLKKLSDTKYLQFNQKIINTKYQMLGIRIPILRQIARKIAKGNIESFLALNTQTYYEEVFIHGLVISYTKDLDTLIKRLDNYLPLIDNWAICDSLVSSLKIIKNNKEDFHTYIQKNLFSKEEYKVRFSLVIILNYYLQKDYLEEIFDFLNKGLLDKYYVNMAASWLLCECYITYPQKTYKFLQNNTLNPFILNKTISKINDSLKVTKEEKERIKNLKKSKLDKIPQNNF